jgi:hypothetical protein
MSILSQEYLNRCGLLRDGLPNLFSAAYPRRIQFPQRNYEDPKFYAASASAILALGGNTDNNARNYVVAGIDLCVSQLIKEKVPTFFVDSEFLRALTATDLSDDFEFQYLKWPFDAMLFCLPVDVMKEIFPVPVPWIAISRIPAGKHDIGVHYHVNFEEDRIAFHYPVFAEPDSSTDFGGMWPTTGKLKEYIDSRPFLDDTYMTNQGTLTPEQDAEISRKATQIATMIVLGMIARPEYVEMGPQLRKEKIIPNRPHKSYDALWGANIVGAKYSRKHDSERTAGHSGVTRRFWKRRGHMRNQIYGKMKDESGARIPAQLRPHELIWIDPVGD